MRASRSIARAEAWASEAATQNVLLKAPAPPGLLEHLRPANPLDGSGLPNSLDVAKGTHPLDADTQPNPLDTMMLPDPRDTRMRLDSLDAAAARDLPLSGEG